MSINSEEWVAEMVAPRMAAIQQDELARAALARQEAERQSAITAAGIDALGRALEAFDTTDADDLDAPNDN